MKLIPMVLPLVAGAWFWCLRWVMQQADARALFKEDTGIDIEEIASSRGINAMIDGATGRQREAIAAFADWVTEELWGVEGRNRNGNGRIQTANQRRKRRLLR